MIQNKKSGYRAINNKINNKECVVARLFVISCFGCACVCVLRGFWMIAPSGVWR